MKTVKDYCILEQERQAEGKTDDYALISLDGGFAFSVVDLDYEDEDDDEDEVHGTTFEPVFFSHWSNIVALLTLGRQAIPELRTHAWNRMPEACGLESWLVRVGAPVDDRERKAKAEFERTLGSQTAPGSIAETARNAGKASVAPGVELRFDTTKGYFFAQSGGSKNPVFTADAFMYLLLSVLGDAETAKSEHCAFQHSPALAGLLKQISLPAPAQPPAPKVSLTAPPLGPALAERRARETPAQMPATPPVKLRPLVLETVSTGKLLSVGLDRFDERLKMLIGS